MDVPISRRLRRQASRSRIAGLLIMLLGIGLAIAFREAVLGAPPDPSGTAAATPPDILGWFIVGVSLAGVGLLMLVVGAAARDRPL